MDGQRQQYVPLPPPPSMQNSQSHIITSLPPPPPRHPPTQTQGVALPPPPGPPPNAAYAKLPQQHGCLAWQQAWARQPVPQSFPPPPPPPLIPANPTQNQHLAYNRQPAALSIPPPPPSGEGQPLTSATYIPMGDSFGPGVGIPAYADSYTRPTYDSYGQTATSQSYEPVNADPSHKRDAHAPATPLGRNGPSSLGLPDNVLSPGQSSSVNRTTDLSKSPSHRHNNSSASLGGMSPNEASTQWPLERVLLWLAKNGFSKDWQETFRALELQGADFIELGYGSNGFGNFGKMHKVVYPQLAKECEKSGTGWDSSREREEGKKMRRLIRQIHDQGHHDAGSLTPRRQEPHSAVDNSPRLEPVFPIHSAVEGSPGLRAPHNQRQNPQMRSVTMPNYPPSSHDIPALDPTPPETSTWVPAEHHRTLLSAVSDNHRRQRSNDSAHLPLSARPHEDSPKSGSPATQPTTLANHGLSSSSTSDLSVRFEHSRGNSSDSTRARYYERKQDQEGARPSPQDPYSRHWNGETLHREQNKILKFFKKKARPNDSSHPSPEELHLESPTSPVHTRGTYTPYGHPNYSRSDVSLGGRPLSGSQSDFERLPVRPKPAQKGKKFVFVTIDGWNYRLVDLTDIDSVGTIRSAICQNLGISDWPSAQIFLTEPGQTEHDDPLDDSLLTVTQRTKSDSFGSLKFFVRGTHPYLGANSAAHFTGLGVSFPEKAAASPTTGPHHVHRKPLDEEALSRISPHHQPLQQTRSPVTKLPARDFSQPFVGVSPAVDGSAEPTGTHLDPEKAALLARQEEHSREIERKQKANNITRGPPLTQQRKDAVYGETGYRREGVIDFDSPRISPYEDKKAEHLVPHRKPPTAPNESNTLTKVNSLRKKDSDRPRIQQPPQPQPQPQSHGLGAALASMGKLTSAIGTPSTNPADNKAAKDTPDELKAAPATWNETPKTPIVTEKSPISATSPVPKPALQSRKSYGPEFDFEEANVSFQRTPDLQEDDSDDDDDDDDDDSDDGLFAIPIANQSQEKGQGSATASPEAQKAARPSLTLDTEQMASRGRSVTFKTPSISDESFVNGGIDNREMPAPTPFGAAESPEDERPPRRDSFARGDIWASRPPVEGVIDNLDDFFPNVDLDAPYLEGQGGSPPTSPASKNPAEVDSHRTQRQDGYAPASSFNQDGEPTIKPQDPGVVARRNVNRSGGGLARMKSIREVAKGANQTSRSKSVAHSGPQKSGDILRRKSTKMFGAKIMQISPRPGRRLNQLDPIPQNKPSQEPVPQRQPTFRIIRGQLIGKGTFGRVYLGMNADNGEVLAVKQVDINPRLAGQDRDRVKDMVSALNQEIDTMQHLEHPNIVQYLGCERGELSISIYLEYISGGSVGSCLRKHGKFEESVVQSLTRQTLDGLAYLHHQGILHRDLKADNILLDLDGSCRISDFGISKKTDDIYGNDSTNSMQGSVFWMAPEVIQSQGQGYSAKVDIWSLGCVVLEMFAGRRPWSREEAIGAIFKLGSLNQAPPIPEDVSMNISPAALAFMYDCFTVDSSDRPTAETLLTHPFCAPDSKYNFLDTELYAKIRHVL